MNVLDTIIAHKKEEVRLAKDLVSIKQLEQSSLFLRKTNSLKRALYNSKNGGIIAEHKRKSPSKGIINGSLTVEQVTGGYTKAGALGLSVLTDQQFFGGKKEDLEIARQLNPNVAILRKDFMIDPYQIIEAKAWGADVILLIAANLTNKDVFELAKFAHSLHMEVLLEIHNEQELEGNVHEYIDMIGVNNRNLKTFEVNIQTSKDLSKVIPDSFVKIAESGLNSASEVVDLLGYGFKGFLIGESFMKTNEPGKACKSLIQEIDQLRP
ncbi:MAG: indole-3-glycerol phosphate synthase TrpC [Bacteroidota bacterium]|nr:indole-3-glycerol phosphate synthase TrpC [Bacteroidota bacterium]